MNETTLLLAVVTSAFAACANFGGAFLNYVAKRAETRVTQTANDREWIDKLQSRVEDLEERLTARDERIEALETEVAQLHHENAELRTLLERQKLTATRPRLRVVTDKDGV